MKYSVIYEELSREDLRRLRRYIAQKSSVKIAANYIKRLIVTTNDLKSFPHRGTARPDLAPNVRNFGFEGRITIFFRVSDEQKRVSILAILYAGRSLETIYRQRI